MFSRRKVWRCFRACCAVDVLNSNRSSNTGPAGGNIGYPAEPPEIDWFVMMMKKAAPKIAEDDLKVIETALRAQKK